MIHLLLFSRPHINNKCMWCSTHLLCSSLSSVYDVNYTIQSRFIYQSASKLHLLISRDSGMRLKLHQLMRVYKTRIRMLVTPVSVVRALSLWLLFTFERRPLVAHSFGPLVNTYVNTKLVIPVVNSWCICLHENNLELICKTKFSIYTCWRCRRTSNAN